MSEPSQPPPTRPPPFRPRFAIGMFYLALFFFLFSFLQILPGLLEILGSMPAGPDQERAAAEVGHANTRPLVSLALSLVTTSLGSYYKVLPGMREG